MHANVSVPDRFDLINVYFETRAAGRRAVHSRMSGLTVMFWTTIVSSVLLLSGITLSYLFRAVGPESHTGEVAGVVLCVAGMVVTLTGIVIATRRDKAVHAVLSDELALLRCGFGTRGGVGTLPATVVLVDSARFVEIRLEPLGQVIREYVDGLTLTPSQQQLFDQLLAEGYVGSLDELVAAAVSLA